MTSNPAIRLGVNIDHVATIRQARFTPYPDLEQMVAEVEAGGADGITLHLREDRRHIQDQDVRTLRRIIRTRMNLEMAPSAEMVRIACEVVPEDCCLVPERREELTTEGGLDVLGQRERLRAVCRELAAAGVRVSIFIEPDLAQISAAAEICAPVIELHTGTYANSQGEEQQRQLERLIVAANHAGSLGLVVNAGHGLDYRNVIAIKRLPGLHELNIGHSIVARALFVGMRQAVREMRVLLD
ncbi:MAG: pyridoxine 5'-phosphate synthase [Thiotrichales bacterium]